MIRFDHVLESGIGSFWLETRFAFGCPIGSLALELGERVPGARSRIAANFDAWCEAIRECLEEAAGGFSQPVDTGELARFVLTVMEGAVMQARAYRSIEPFDASVSQLRAYFRLLLAGVAEEGRAEPPSSRSRP